MTRILDALRWWPARRWLVALAATLVCVLAVGVPTDLVDTPVFGRSVPPTWWAWPSLLVSSVLAGMLVASYVNSSVTTPQDPGSRRGGWLGGALTIFAVGCPVCNKLVLLALGSAGAMTWFAPVQPWLQAAAVLLLGWALHRRLVGELACAAPGQDRRSTEDRVSLRS